jgi:hypothetical protein
MVVMVLKKGTWCMCPDFHALNKIVIKDKFPIPVTDDILDEHKGDQFFTKLDLHLGYHHIHMKEAHVSHVDHVLQLLSHRQLFLKRSKCAFCIYEVEYLDHIVSKDGVQINPNKIEAVKEWPCPTTLKSLQGFLG